VSVDLSPDGRLLLAGCLDGTIHLIEKDHGVEINRYRSDF
jgi:hypothetical protein